VPESRATSSRRRTSGCSGEFSLGGSFAKVGVISALLFVFTLMLSDFFDTMGTIVGVGAEGDLLDATAGCPASARC
jgi:AGZA family xanthine/uracil permease-like MFS transporter